MDTARLITSTRHTFSLSPRKHHTTPLFFCLECSFANADHVDRGYFVEYLFEHPAVRDVWNEFLYHPFVMALGNGTLPLESFKGYIIQDYLYLVYSLFQSLQPPIMPTCS